MPLVVMESPNASFALGSRFVSLIFLPEHNLTFSLVFYFRQVPLLSDARITEILEVGGVLFTCFLYIIETC
jgi:hypothetical protein